MNANDPNVALLEIVAAHLGDALLTQMVFVATKLEAFADRGKGDFFIEP
jgi:hypothetical protein